MRRSQRATITFLAVAIALAAACVPNVQPAPTIPPTPGATAAPTSATAQEVGTAERPIVVTLAPTRDTARVAAISSAIARSLEAASGLQWDVRVPTSYAETVEGLCAGEIDLAWLAPVGYVLASQQNCAEVMLAALRTDETGTLSTTYNGQVLVRADSGINDLKGLKGKDFAYGGPLTAAETLYWIFELREATGEDPASFFSSSVFAVGHERAVLDLYQGRVDGVATLIDVRSELREKFPDIMERTKRVATAGPIPNEALAIRPSVPEASRTRILDALLAYQGSDAGQTALRSLYGIGGLARADAATYDPLLEAARLARLDLEAEAAKTAAPVAPTASP